MSKPKTVPVGASFVREQREEYQEQANEPLSGSKKVKNRQHSRRNQGEGS